MVHLVQIDEVGLQPAQAAFAGELDVARGKAAVVRNVAHLPVRFRRQHDLFATATALREPAANDLFGESLAFSPAVNIGGIEEVDAEFKGLVHDRKAVGFFRVPTEVHRAETERADVQAGAAEGAVVHDDIIVARRQVDKRAPIWCFRDAMIEELKDKLHGLHERHEALGRYL